MDIAFTVNAQVPAGGMVFQDEGLTEVQVFDLLPEENVIESFGEEVQRSIFAWDPEVYLDGFRLSECQDMDEAIERATGWKLRYTRLDQTREPSIERVGGMEVRTAEGITEVSVWSVNITGFAGEIVKASNTQGEERIYAI